MVSASPVAANSFEMLLGLRMRRIQLQGPLKLGNRFIKAALNPVKAAE
jgi:hypothetical protein